MPYIAVNSRVNVLWQPYLNKEKVKNKLLDFPRERKQNKLFREVKKLKVTHQMDPSGFGTCPPWCSQTWDRGGYTRFPTSRA